MRSVKVECIDLGSIFLGFALASVRRVVLKVLSLFADECLQLLVLTNDDV